MTGPVQVRIQTFGARANADVDNLAKGVLDSMQGIVFSDDKQVEHLAITRIAAKANKRVEVEVLT
jgi:Holliday junction resolvase RusA-like endonuclease